MKKYIAWIGGIFVLLCCLFLFGGSKLFNKDKAQRTENAETVLTLMLPHTHDKPFLKELLARFEDENPGIAVEPQVIPDNQWIDIVKAKARVRETPDIVRIDRGLLMEIGEEHFVEMDENEPWYGRVLEEQLTNKMVNGKLYGLPVSSSTGLGVVYNRRIFEKYSLDIPKTFAQLRQVCRKLKENNIIPLYVSDKDAWTAQLAFDLVAPTVVEDSVWKDIVDNRIKWSEVPEFEPILEAFVSLREDGFTNEDRMDATYESAIDAMAGERAAMYIMGQFFIIDTQEVKPDIDLMVFPLPYQKDVLTVVEGPGQFSVFKDSPHVEEAKIFLNWFSKSENMDVFTSGWGHMPVFSDQKQKLSDCQQVLLDEYIIPGRTAKEIADIIPGIDLSDFWNYQQEMYAGLLSPREVLERWDETYSAQVDKIKG